MVNALGAERAPAVTREIDYDDFRNCRLTYDELVAVYIGLLSNLRDLGIWDAEVLEGQQMGGQIMLDADEVEFIGADSVRVIVLPKEEK